MHVIRPNCRQRFTPADYHFLSASLFKNADADSLWRYIVEDPDHLDDLLDRPGLYKALLELRGCVTVSMPFYFFVMVRHVFMRQGLGNRDLADYVAALLSDFAVHPRMHQPLEGEPERPYYVDLLQALESAQGERHFILCVHIGNRALFESGMLIHAVEERERRRAAPGVRFLEDMGTEFFRQASMHPHAQRLGLVSLFLTLGTAFHTSRLALNQLSDEVVHLAENSAVLNLLQERSP
jgi:hypothetical protein